MANLSDLPSKSMALAALLGALSFGMAQLAVAQEFPTKPVTIIIPFNPGGPSDVIVRTLAEPMAKFLGQRIVVESKPGAGGNIGAEYVSKNSKADGYTLLFGSTTLASSASLMKLNYDARRDLVPVAGLGITPNVAIVGPTSPYRSINELVAAAKAKPASLTFGSSGPGTGSHLAVELFKAAAGVDLLHVPYKGGSAVMADLIAGRVDLVMESQSAALGRVKSGQVRALATTAKQRSAALPDVPAIAESGYPGFEAGAWAGLFAPSGTSAAVVETLETAAVRALRTEHVKERFSEMSMLPIPESSAAFARYFYADIETWAKLVRDGKLQIIQ